jgi:hypothetical protein
MQCEGPADAPLVLSAQQRTYLERQVRRQRVPGRHLSECRVILRCGVLTRLAAKLAQGPDFVVAKRM